MDGEEFAADFHYVVCEVQPLSTLTEHERSLLARAFEQDGEQLTEPLVVYELFVPETYQEMAEAIKFRLVAPSGFGPGDLVNLGGIAGQTVSASVGHAADGTLGSDKPSVTVDWATELVPWPHE